LIGVGQLAPDGGRLEALAEGPEGGSVGYLAAAAQAHEALEAEPVEQL